LKIRHLRFSNTQLSGASPRATPRRGYRKDENSSIRLLLVGDGTEEWRFDPCCAFVQRCAGMYLVVGVAERDRDTIYNSACLIGPEGLVAVYRKTHLMDSERAWASPGDAWIGADTPVGRIGRTLMNGVMTNIWDGEWEVAGTGQRMKGFGVEVWTMRDGKIAIWEAAFNAAPADQDVNTSQAVR
jgi:hypothetical protein